VIQYVLPGVVNNWRDADLLSLLGLWSGWPTAHMASWCMHVAGVTRPAKPLTWAMLLLYY